MKKIMLLSILLITACSFAKSELVLEDGSFISDCKDFNYVNGKSKICKYINENFTPSQDEKAIITRRLKNLDVFDGSIDISNITLKIDYDYKDYDSYGEIAIIFSSDFEYIKDKIINYGKKEVVLNQNKYISFRDEFGTVSLKLQEDGTTKLTIAVKIPYRYSTSTIDEYDEYIKYFLNVNERNIMLINNSEE